MPLKKYETHTTKGLADYTELIPTGVQSGDSENEMMVVKPYQKHPEIDGLYRAIDPETGWRGWVEYKEPQPNPQPQPQPEDPNRKEYKRLMAEYKDKKELVDMGIYTAEEVNLTALKNQIRLVYSEDFL